MHRVFHLPVIHWLSLFTYTALKNINNTFSTRISTAELYFSADEKTQGTIGNAFFARIAICVHQKKRRRRDFTLAEILRFHLLLQVVGIARSFHGSFLYQTGILRAYQCYDDKRFDYMFECRAVYSLHNIYDAGKYEETPEKEWKDRLAINQKLQ